MTRKMLAVLLMGLVVAAGGSVGAAPQGNAPRPQIPLKVDVAISRFQGDKKVGSLPYTLWVQANNNRTVNVRMGVDVPVGSATVTTGQVYGPPTTQGGTTRSTSEVQAKPQYRNVGTSIDCSASSQEDGRFMLTLSVEDSSVFGSEGDKGFKVADAIAFRTFSLNNVQIAMRDGQTQQFTLATDKISGEQLKVDVTLTVVK